MSRCSPGGAVDRPISRPLAKRRCPSRFVRAVAVAIMALMLMTGPGGAQTAAPETDKVVKLRSFALTLCLKKGLAARGSPVAKFIDDEIAYDVEHSNFAPEVFEYLDQASQKAMHAPYKPRPVPGCLAFIDTPAIVAYIDAAAR
jgi:hypothetical protein